MSFLLNRLSSVIPIGGTATLTGNTGGAVSPTAGNINVVGSGAITVTGNPGTHTLTITSSAGGITTIDGDTSSVTGSTVTIKAGHAGLNSGSTVQFTGNGSTTMNFNVTDGNSNTIIGNGSGSLTATGSDNTILGASSGTTLTSGTENCMVGNQTLALTSGSSNCALGYSALGSIDGSSSNNVAIGRNAGGNYTGVCSNNIVINNTGLIFGTESNALRIGSGTGTGFQNLNKAFICGIDGINVGSVAKVVTMASDQLGTATITAGSGITITPTANTITIAASGGGSGVTTIDGDSGSVTGSTVTLTGGTSGAVFTGSGATVTESFNYLSLPATTSTNGQIRINGSPVLIMPNNTSNIFVGANAGYTGLSGGGNAGIGQNALSALLSGSYNFSAGYLSGTNFTSSESSNISINSLGVVGDANTLRIGAGTGTGNQQLNEAFISGINGITVTGTAVLVSSSDQLGIAVSSARYKDNIADMGDVSSKVMDLRPVTFTYNVGEDQSPQTGLIAEEVNAIMPSLVVLDKEGLPQTVKYHDLPALLLNELQKLSKRVAVLENELKRI